MALSDYREEYSVSSNYKNVVFGIYQQENITGTHINRTLKIFQKQLAEEDAGKGVVSKAFVYGNKRTWVRDFSQTEPDRIYYMDFHDYCVETISISKIWFMGLALLEKKDKEDKKKGIVSKNILYLLVSSPKAVKRVEENIIIHTNRFHSLDFTPILIKPDGLNLGELEVHISNKKGQVYSASEIL